MKMVDETSGSGAKTPSGGPDKKIIYAVIGIAVVILAAVLIAKVGYNTDLLNPAGGQMSLVRDPGTLVRPNITISPQQTHLGFTVATTAFQRVTTPIPRLPSCTLNQTDCNGVCVYLQSDPANCGSCGTASTAGMSCKNGQCTCPSGQTLCGGHCINTNLDLNNCGSCGNVCPTTGGSGQPRNCVSGKCTWGCTTGETWCGGTDCIHTQTDPNNCGHCGTVCPAGEICLNSVCHS
jgi:hypothetical protein